MVQDSSTYRLNAFAYRVNSPRDQVTNDIKLFVTFDAAISTVSEVTILYADKRASITLTSSTLESLKTALQNLGVHIDALSAIFTQNP